jgi:hypothetical protein
VEKKIIKIVATIGQRFRGTQTWVMWEKIPSYHDLNLRIMTKETAWKGVGQECNIHIPGGVKDCQWMSPHTPK